MTPRITNSTREPLYQKPVHQVDMKTILVKWVFERIIFHYRHKPKIGPIPIEGQIARCVFCPQKLTDFKIFVVLFHLSSNSKLHTVSIIRYIVPENESKI